MRPGQYVLAVISLGNKLLSNKLCKCPKAFEVACVWFNLDLRSPGRWCEDCAKSKKNKWLALSQSNNNYETIHDMQQIKFYGFTLITAKNFHTQCNLVIWATPEVEIHTCLQQSTILMLQLKFQSTNFTVRHQTSGSNINRIIIDFRDTSRTLERFWVLIPTKMKVGEGLKKTKWKFKMAFAMKGGRGGLACHQCILKNDFFKNHLQSFPDCENVFCT